MAMHDPMGPCPICEEILTTVQTFFGGDSAKWGAWLATINPNFGGLSPIALMMMGRHEVVLAFVRDAMEANEGGPV